MTGEKIYEYDVIFTGVTDYGVSLEAMLAGKEPIPPQGARFDVAFEGREWPPVEASARSRLPHHARRQPHRPRHSSDHPD